MTIFWYTNYINNEDLNEKKDMVQLQLIEEIQKKMEEILPKDRFLHTVGVAHLASSIAMCYKEDPNRSMLAGLLHDNAKYIPYEQAVKECEENNIPITEEEYLNPMLLHGKLGAFYAKTKYMIDDEEIISTIQYHTTGKPNMSFLEKNIFLSDYIEPRRTQATKPALSEIRATAFFNLDLSVYYALDNTLRYLQRNKRTIDEISKEALEYYKTVCNK